MEYLKSIFNETPDPRGSAFPIISGGLPALLSLLVPIIIALRYIGPMWMRNKKPIDLSPIILIYNGLMFGINGAGFLMTLTVTEMTQDAWICGRATPRTPGLKSSAIIYLGYTYFLIKFLEFIRIGFAIARKREDQSNLASILNPAGILLIIHTGLYYYPGGIFCFLPLADTLVSTVTYGYYVLATGKQINYARWKKPMIMLQMLQYAALLTHAMYFLTQSNCGVPHIVLLLQGVYALSALIHLPSYHRKILFSPPNSCPTQTAVKMAQTKCN